MAAARVMSITSSASVVKGTKHPLPLLVLLVAELVALAADAVELMSTLALLRAPLWSVSTVPFDTVTTVRVSVVVGALSR